MIQAAEPSVSNVFHYMREAAQAGRPRAPISPSLAA